LLLSSAVPGWRQRAAAALGIRTTQLPQDAATISTQLCQAAVTYTATLLTGASITVQDLSNPLKAAILSGVPQSVPQLLGCVPVAEWALVQLEPAISAAASTGCIESFKKLVNAGLAAVKADATTAAAGGKAGHLLVLDTALSAAAGFGNGNLLGWVLQLGQGLWTPESVYDSLDAAASKGHVKVLQQLLSECGIVWTPDQLADTLDLAAQHPRAGKPMMRLLLAATGGSGEDWLAEHLAEALTSAVTYKQNRASAVKMLLQYPGIVWTCADLQPAVEALARHEASCGYTDLKVLLAAATDEWTAEQLSTALANSIPMPLLDGTVNFNILLNLESVQWTVPSLIPAIRKACQCYFQELAVDKLCKRDRLSQLLQMPGLEWEAGQFISVARAILEQGHENMWECLQVLLLQKHPIVSPPESLAVLMELMVGSRAAAVYTALEQPKQHKDKDFIRRSAMFVVKMGQCMQDLLDLAPGVWTPELLKNALVLAAAAGDAALVSALLAAAQDGKAWDRGHVVLALKAAGRAKHWSIVSQLLAAPAGGWRGEQLWPVANALARVGGEKAEEMLLQRAVPFLVDRHFVGQINESDR
jgi:hypothetical protein